MVRGDRLRWGASPVGARILITDPEDQFFGKEAVCKAVVRAKIVDAVNDPRYGEANGIFFAFDVDGAEYLVWPKACVVYPRPPKPTARQATFDREVRNCKIVQMRKEGGTLRAIGRAFGITAETVRGILARAERRAKRDQELRAKHAAFCSAFPRRTFSRPIDMGGPRDRWIEGTPESIWLEMHRG